MAFISTFPANLRARKTLEAESIDVLQPSRFPPEKQFWDEYSYNEVADVLDIIQSDAKYDGITSVLYIHADLVIAPTFRFSLDHLSSFASWTLHPVAAVNASKWAHVERVDAALSEIRATLGPRFGPALDRTPIGWSDFYSIPRSAFADWTGLARIFARHKVMNEVAIPMSFLLTSLLGATKAGDCRARLIESPIPEDVFGSNQQTWMTPADLEKMRNGSLRCGHRLNLRKRAHVRDAIVVWEEFEFKNSGKRFEFQDSAKQCNSSEKEGLTEPPIMKAICTDPIFLKIVQNTE
mmetsp:Transcript_23643/g.58764  ORF Transcript_23643/g.58764 Transcript_23643/m.58764 type:complete len:294 (-) Transcript_23643:33-914(-)